MKKINCNVIRDLLPSYVDEICSVDSRLLIEEHLTGCEQCRTQLGVLKNIELTDEQGERKRVSYLKKIKRHYANNGIISLIFLTLMIIGGFRFVVHHYEMMGSLLFYILFPLLIIAAYCLMPDDPIFAKQSRISIILVIGSIMLLIYLAILVYGSISVISTGSSPFGMSLKKVGPFFCKQFILIAVMQLGIFVLSNIFLFRGYQINQCIYGLSLTGIWLAAGYICILHNMSTVEEFYKLLSKITGYLILEGIVFSTAAHIFAKKVIN